MAKFYSETEGGFFDDSVHDAMPADAVAIDDATWAQLLADQEAGATIESDVNGSPISTPLPEPTLAEKQAQIAAEIATEAEKRASTLAAMREDLNELRRLYVANAAPTQAQLDRWAQIDALEADQAQVEADMLAEPDPYAFDYRDNTRWTIAY